MKLGSHVYRIVFDDFGRPLSASACEISAHDDLHPYELQETLYDASCDDAELSTLTSSIIQDAE